LRILLLEKKQCICSHAPRRKPQITVRFTGHHARIVGFLYRTGVMSPSWRLEFGGGSSVF